MKTSFDQLLEMLEKANDLFDLYWSIGEKNIAYKYWAIGNRIVKCIYNPENKFV